MKGKNPFCISFGTHPVEYISRTMDQNLVLSTFMEKPVTDQIYLVTGIRGSGKTVFMNQIANTLEQRNNWIILRESATSEINQMIYSDLFHQLKRHDVSVQELTVSLAGNGISAAFKEPETNVVTQIDEILKALQKKEKNVLVVVDEVTKTPQMKDFSHMFQIEISRQRPLFFIGTGLYENLQALSNEADLTFLHRAPKIVLAPLNYSSVMDSYRQIFGISEERAGRLARMTRGYSFAFQALGYVCWEKDCPEDIEQILPSYDALLADASYSKIWSECSQKDQLVLKKMAESGKTDVGEIRKACNMEGNVFSVYRSRLIRRGILISPSRGALDFALPRFEEFVRAETY